MEEEYKIYAYCQSSFYYKGNSLSDLEIWNDGFNCFVKEKEIDLYLSNGKFYKKEYEKEYKNNIKSDVKVERFNIQKTVIQVDYKFYVAPICERISIMEGRWKLIQMLKRFGIKGFINTYEYMPLEYSFANTYRINTKSFIDFDYDDYIKNYNDFVKDNKNFEKDAYHLKFKNIEYICKFYNIKELELNKIKSNRLKYAIKVLNNKINNNRKNN